MRILISGAGIAGLTLAALLRQRGIEADIMERAEALDSHGYVLGLYPLGSRILHGLGVYDDFLARSEAMETYCIANARGRVFRKFDFRPITEAYGTIQTCSRGLVMDLVRGSVGGIRPRMATTITRARPMGERVAVKTSDGAESEYDLLVGADGIHSSTRKLVSRRTETFDTRWACWTWWTERGDMPPQTIIECWGAGTLLGLYPVGDRIGVVACAPARRLANGRVEGRRARVQALFGKLGGVAGDVMASFPADDEEIFYWKLEDRRAQDWSKGRIALVGDAAVAFLPTAGVGASIAMQGAAALAEELCRTDAEHIPLALKFYEERRRAKAEAAQKDSRNLSKLMFVRSGALSGARNLAIRFMTTKSLARDIVKLLAQPV
ncbi:MAG: NAD(P)-binding protein [Alphaproteobacteria bacterium]|nr:NAD(P)-binding protein [Alphaproteobacteria bacterium]